MNIVFLGPPASGKGTQAQRLAESLGYFYLSTGQMLRSMHKNAPELANIMNSGGLIPDDMLMTLLTRYLENNKKYNEMIIDGTPRSVYQYDKLQEWFNSKGTRIDKVVFLDIGEETVIERLSARRQDKVSGKVYNLITNPPGKDVDPGNLTIRDDDKPEVIKERLEEYEKQTKPLITKLKEEGILIEIDGERPIDVIFTDILNKLETKSGN